MSSKRFQKVWRGALRTVTVPLQARKAAVLIAIVVCCGVAETISAASCKPDASGQDRITKQRIDQWSQVLSSSGFLSAALMDNDVTFTAFVKRVGDHNFVLVSIEKVEESMARAAFESHYHGAKGDQLVLGFKNGEPLSFVVTEVANQAQADLFGKLHMSVVWAAEIPLSDLAAMRDTFTTRQVDAIRITQAGGQVDEGVSDQNGKKLMAKFGCFYEALDQSGVDLKSAGNKASTSGSGVAGTQTDATAREDRQGRYLRKGKSGDSIVLSHGAFSLSQDGHSLEGTYTIQGDVVTLAAPRMRAATGRFMGDTIKDDTGIVWEKEVEPAKKVSSLTVEQVIQMASAKLADDIIITTIQNSHSTFDLTPEVLIKLKGAGVSDAVMRAMAH